ncbi:MAG: molybdopterin-dependent oxidoreductase [Acidimicrobiales bacterium]|nr:molybdopterin-dependent oxidoreductase [Acidimicrobiales bacterium]
MTDSGSGRLLQLNINGATVEVPDRGDSLLGVLRDDLKLTGAKDGCSPQGQCGCCTVLIDGQPRVACVTPARRLRGRSVVTIEGLDPDRAELWGAALCSTGGSQCGFCTPAIVLRLEATMQDPQHVSDDDAEVEAKQALLAHLCRCTGWQTITEAFTAVRNETIETPVAVGEQRSERIELEGGVAQEISPRSALGAGGFAADTAPADRLVAVPDENHMWHVAATLQEARALAGKVQGRRTTIEPTYPIPIPDGDWVASFQTTWTDPAYLETDASWCEPGGEPATALGNGGAFGGKRDAEVEHAARRLADEHRRPVLALYSREDVMRRTAKRPPLATGIRADGTGVINVAATSGVAELVTSVAPEFEVREFEFAGPPTSLAPRAAVWAEIAVARAALSDPDAPITVVSPQGGTATVSGGSDGIHVEVDAGAALAPEVLRSYCIGAAHMGWSWATSEALTVDLDGQIHDLTVRSLGILRAVDTPPITVSISDEADRPGVNGSDAVFAAVAALAWRQSGFARRFPVDLNR